MPSGKQFAGKRAKKWKTEGVRQIEPEKMQTQLQRREEIAIVRGNWGTKMSRKR